MLNNVFNKYISTAISMDFKQYTVKKIQCNYYNLCSIWIISLILLSCNIISLLSNNMHVEIIQRWCSRGAYNLLQNDDGYTGWPKKNATLTSNNCKKMSK